MAARMRRKASESGHPTPNPSPVQKVPKVVNMIPTTNFSEFSGTFDSDARESTYQDDQKACKERAERGRSNSTGPRDCACCRAHPKGDHNERHFESFE